MNDSQHLKRGQVAPFNPNPRWPTGYFQVLEELGVEEPRRPFYAHWVRQFFKRSKTENGGETWAEWKSRHSFKLWPLKLVWRTGRSSRPGMHWKSTTNSFGASPSNLHRQWSPRPKEGRTCPSRPIGFQLLVCLNNRRPSQSQRGEVPSRKWTWALSRKQPV